eukprot:TRINITY_DN7291_c0_g1_i1.p1 TRINITY_DN7291_c0_g1~~TRINITY_DN7291_c0_g1_i1.p1  ORF type:complete len:267 (-),score=21.03 TRINITY_DN7291_c0_g1_i1:371-1171(-)
MPTFVFLASCFFFIHAHACSRRISYRVEGYVFFRDDPQWHCVSEGERDVCYEQALPSVEPVVWLDFNNGTAVNKASPGMYDLSFHGSGPFDYVPGKDGSWALKAPAGELSYFRIDNAKEILSADGYTISFWLKSDSCISTSGRIVDNRVSSGGFELYHSPGNGCKFYSCSAGCVSDFYDVAYYGGKWIHVAARWEPQDDVRIYINGLSFLRVPTGTEFINDSDSHLKFGTRSAADTFDDIRIYQTALGDDVLCRLAGRMWDCEQCV